ncbi:translocation/assembly module TamB domain-containing protein [Pacificimonas sp. ICDLI1SI03]
MAETMNTPDDVEVEAKESSGSPTALKWLGIVIAALLLLIVLLVFALDTGPGRRFVAQQISGLEFENGMDIEVGAIDGSLYGGMVVTDLSIADPDGVFLTIPRAEMDWHPLAYASGLIDIDRLEVPQATLSRLPAFRETPTDPNEPLIPDINLDIDRLSVGRLDIGEAVTGSRHALTLAGDVLLDGGQATVELDARALSEDGLAGGDRFDLSLLVDPADDKLNVAMDLIAPADGLVAGMTGVARPLRARIEQSVGTWTNWNGRLLVDSAGEAITRLDLSAEEGLYRVRGPLALSSFLEGPAARMAGERLTVDATVDTRAEIMGVDVAVRADAFTVDAAGGLALDRSSFENMVIEAQLLEPGAIAEGIAGRAIRTRLVLNDAFTVPDVDYELTAEAIGINDMLVEDLVASGDGRVEDGGMVVPLNATARRVSGLPDAVGGLMTNLKANGTFRIADGRAVSDDLKLTTDRIDVTALIVADFASGTYTGAIQGRVNRYEVPGLGLVDLVADIKLVPGPNGSFGLRGPIAVQTRRIDNETVQEFFGGQAKMTADFTAPGDGIYGVENIRVTAPGLRASGKGRYTPDGRIALNLAGTSRAYGRFTTAISGTTDAPVIRVTAANPTLGIAFTDVEAVIRGTAAGYDVQANGGTPYGDFDADLLIRTGDALIIDIERATLAGVTAAGTIRQAAAGPFVGDLSLSGNGVAGNVSLGAREAVQTAALNARIRDFSSGGETPIGIRRADIDATIALPDSGPTIDGEAQMADVRYGTFRIAKARAEFEGSPGGTGTARLVAEGSAPTPYEIAVNARLGADSILAAIKGEISGQSVQSVRPLRIMMTDEGYRLAPATLRLREGDVRIAGSYGDGIMLQSRFDKFDLGILNAFAPAAGFGGSATGSVDFRQTSSDAFPEADMRLKLDDFTRSGAVAVSQPVDITMVGKLNGEGGDLSALMRERGRIVGRMKAALSPSEGGTGSWSEQLFAAPLSGGLRYNGPASALFSFAGLAGQHLEGPLAIAADVSGRLDAPRLTGVVKANSLVYENETFGTRIADLRLDGRFTNTDFVLNQMAGRAGEGTVSASGRASLSAEDGYPIDLSVTVDNAQLAEGEGISARVSGDLNIVNGPNRPASISGTLTLPEARYRIVRQGGEEIAELAGVRRRPVSLESVENAAGEEEEAVPPSDWNLDIDIRADNRIFVTGMGLESEWQMDLNVGGTASDYRVRGELEILRGTFGFANSSFDLTRGIIEMTGEKEINPRLDIRAETDVDTVTAIINITGRAYDPQIAFTSRPVRPEDEILSLILFGGPPSELGALEAVQLAASLNSLRGSGGGGLNPIASLRGATGFDRLKIVGADEATGRGTALAVGQYLADDIYVEVITDTRGFTATQIEIALSRALSILSSVSTFGGQAVNLRYSKDY